MTEYDSDEGYGWRSVLAVVFVLGGLVYAAKLSWCPLIVGWGLGSCGVVLWVWDEYVQKMEKK